MLVWAKPGICTNLPGFMDAPPAAGYTATKTTVAHSNIFRGSGVVNVLRRIPYPLAPTMFSFLHRFPRTGMPPSSISSTAWNLPTNQTWARCSYFLRPLLRVFLRPQWGPVMFLAPSSGPRVVFPHLVAHGPTMENVETMDRCFPFLTLNLRPIQASLNTRKNRPASGLERPGVDSKRTPWRY